MEIRYVMLELLQLVGEVCADPSLKVTGMLLGNEAPSGTNKVAQTSTGFCTPSMNMRSSICRKAAIEKKFFGIIIYHTEILTTITYCRTLPSLKALFVGFVALLTSQ